MWVSQALALGADAVMVGRPVLWGLTVGGQEGVRKVAIAYVLMSGRRVTTQSTHRTSDVMLQAS